MHEESSADAGHTKVCRTENHFTGSLRALLVNEIETRKLTLTELSKDMGYSRRTLGRMLSGEKQLSVHNILTMCNALGIDRLIAWFAIECMDDWNYYHDATLQIALRLLKPVILKINERATSAIEPLSAGALEILSDWIANTVIQNQQQIYSRRERFVELPQL